MIEAYQRILKALHLEKHQTGKQLARLLYPQEYANDVKNKAYQRVMKNLKKLESEKLLKSKSYGLAKDKFWFLVKHPIITELGYAPPKSEVHTFKYEHEKDCAEVFVSLALTDRLMLWEGEGTQKKGFRHDRKFEIGEDSLPWYLEVERGNQMPQKLRVKIEQYIRHFHETKEPFHVVFTVQDEAAVEQLVYLFEEFKLGNHYSAVVFD